MKTNNDVTQKPSEGSNPSTLSFLGGYLKQHKKDVVLTIVFAVFSAVAVLVDPYLREKVVDQILGGIMTDDAAIDIAGVGMMCLGCALCQLLKFYSDQKQHKLLIGVSTGITNKMRGNLNEKLDRLPMSYFFNNSSGDTLARVVNDTEVIGQNLATIILYVVSGAILLVAVLILMFVSNVQLSLVCVITTLAGTALMLITSRFSSKSYTKLAYETGGMNGYIEENFSNHNIVSAYNHQESSMREFEEINGSMKKSTFKAQAVGGLGAPISSFTTYFSTLLIFVIGLQMTLSGSCTFGRVIAFTSYNSILGGPINNIANAIPYISNMNAALKRIMGLLSEEELQNEEDKATAPAETSGEVLFDHVRFGYDPNKVIIKDFSLHVRPGQNIAIVGPTGAGKTTLLNLLMRFYEVNGGKIYVDGTDTSLITREDLRKKFSMVLQEPWVFDGTLLENLTFGTKDAQIKKVEKALVAVGLDYYVNTLPDGLKTMLGDDLQLSQGQKQQISIARAMIADRPIVILDEATSSIDTRTEKKIQDAMNKITVGRTSFVIAHRLSTIKSADVILVLKDGDIVEQGNHEELLERHGFYHELYYSQFDQTSSLKEASDSVPVGGNA